MPTVVSADRSRFMPDMIKNMDMTGGVKLLICRYSFLSLVRLIYDAPKIMQESSGEISRDAQIPEIPRSMAIARISLLSLLLAGIRSRLKK